MLRNRRTKNRKKPALLGLSALALVAISAFAVTGAQAEGESNYEFTCLENHETHVHCTGVGIEVEAHHEERSDHRFDFGLSDLTCSQVKSEVTT